MWAITLCGEYEYFFFAEQFFFNKLLHYIWKGLGLTGKWLLYTMEKRIRWNKSPLIPEKKKETDTITHFVPVYSNPCVKFPMWSSI